MSIAGDGLQLLPCSHAVAHICIACTAFARSACMLTHLCTQKLRMLHSLCQQAAIAQQLLVGRGQSACQSVRAGVHL